MDAIDNLETVAKLAKRVEKLLENTGSTAGAILVDTGGAFRVQTSLGLRLPETMVDSDQVRTVLRTDSTEIIEIPADVEIASALVDFRPRAVIFLPVSHKNVPLGVVVLASARSFEANVKERLELFRQGLGLALNNALTHDRLQRLAALDPLTGPKAQEAIRVRVKAVWQVDAQCNRRVCIDIEHF